jgi:transcriptional regulator with XRE-family HTH domain
MCLFFDIVENARIEQKRLATLMGVSEATFTRVKKGQRSISGKFAEAATRAIAEIGIRRPDGAEYNQMDLFSAHVDTPVSNRNTEVSVAAD